MAKKSKNRNSKKVTPSRRAPRTSPVLHRTKTVTSRPYTPIKSGSVVSPYKPATRARRRRKSITLPVATGRTPPPNRYQLSPTSFFQGGSLVSSVPKTTPNRMARAFVCARRKIRREVIFASGKGGKKISAPKYNNQSKIKC